MVSIGRRFFVSLSIFLALFSLVFAEDPEPTDLDYIMHNHARNYYHSSGLGQFGPDSNDATYFSDEKLSYYREKYGRYLARELHRHAKDSDGVIELHPPAASPPGRQWGEPRQTWFKKKLLGFQKASSSNLPISPSTPPVESSKYYVSIVQPDTWRGTKMPAETAGNAPYGKQVLALWKWEGGKLHLVGMDTWSARLFPFPHTLTKLSKVVPLDHLDDRSIVTNATPWFELIEKAKNLR